MYPLVVTCILLTPIVACMIHSFAYDHYSKESLPFVTLAGSLIWPVLFVVLALYVLRLVPGATWRFVNLQRESAVAFWREVRPARPAKLPKARVL